jgi:hypothetical protein
LLKFFPHKISQGVTTSGQGVFAGKFHQTFKGKVIPILCKYLQKVEDEGTLPP